MNNVTQLISKYRQAPWRHQRQWIGLFLLVIVLVAMVAGIYLNVTAGASVAGREIQILKDKIIDNQRSNHDLETHLAELTSIKSMHTQAEDLGFEPIRPEDITYVIVEGYIPPPPIDLSTHAALTAAPLITTEYTQSLFDWAAQAFILSTARSGEQP
ncbi:MAG: hypothetical protein ABIJ39_09250 [Chloroflexota bacterium]